VAAPDGVAEELPVELPAAAALGVAAGEGVAAEWASPQMRARPGSVVEKKNQIKIYR
jgi:hypothetical protein